MAVNNTRGIKGKCRYFNWSGLRIKKGRHVEEIEQLFSVEVEWHAPTQTSKWVSLWNLKIHWEVLWCCWGKYALYSSLDYGSSRFYGHSFAAKCRRSYFTRFYYRESFLSKRNFCAATLLGAQINNRLLVYECHYLLLIIFKEKGKLGNY